MDGHTDLKDRTKQSALRIISLYQQLPKSTEAQVLGRQLLRAGTSVPIQEPLSEVASDRDEGR
jgi:four helix bundle protein